MFIYYADIVKYQIHFMLCSVLPCSTTVNFTNVFKNKLLIIDSAMILTHCTATNVKVEMNVVPCNNTGQSTDITSQSDAECHILSHRLQS
jgi:hypothetical protein